MLIRRLLRLGIGVPWVVLELLGLSEGTRRRIDPVHHDQPGNEEGGHWLCVETGEFLAKE